MNVLFYIANMPSAPYIYMLSKHLINNIIFKILIALLFNASLYVFGTLQNLINMYLKYRYLVIRPTKLTTIMHGDPPPNTNPINMIMSIFA